MPNPSSSDFLHLAANFSAPTAPFAVPDGEFMFQAVGTYGSGACVLEKQNPDLSWSPIVDLSSGAGHNNALVALSAGTCRFNVSGGAISMYAALADVGPKTLTFADLVVTGGNSDVFPLDAGEYQVDFGLSGAGNFNIQSDVFASSSPGAPFVGTSVWTGAHSGHTAYSGTILVPSGLYRLAALTNGLTYNGTIART